MNNQQIAKTGMKRIIAATKYSISGLRLTIRDEEAFRLEIYLSIFFVPLAFFLADSNIELILMVVAIFIVLITELLNTAIEAVVDKTGEEIHHLAKKAKDVGSAAVFVAMVNFCFIWFLVLVK
jgi:diacylglycerol kinase (ATP)